MQYTENYQFRKPVIGVDDADVKDINFNSDRADTLIHNTQISLAPAYDLNETYDTGDVVMYETLMYKCKADNTTGAWDASKWERTTAGEEGAGGGGTDVEANPTGTPTDTLDTIRIGQTIYDIEGSGGGGSAYKETTLWSGSDSASMTLSESFENYDAVMIIAKTTYNNTEYSMSAIWPVDYMKAHINDGMRFGLTGDSWYIYFSITDSTTFVRQDQYYFYISEVKGLKFGGGSGTTSEIIPISAGDDTTSRTFAFDKTPKFIKFYWGDPVISGGWASDTELVWGQPYMNYRSKPMGATISQVDGGINSISYGADGKSLTITGGNAFGALNTSNGSGYMFVDYGGGSGSSEEISDMTWTELISTTGTSTAVAIPQGTKKLVLTAQLGGIVTKVAEESIANIQKLLDVSLETTWNMGGEYADTAGNHTTIAMSVSNGQVVAKSGYSTVTAKVYALS